MAADRGVPDPEVPPWEVSDPAFEHEGVRLLTVASAALRGRGDISVHVPPEAAAGASLPILVLLHGVYGSHWAWFAKAGAHRTARRLAEAGEIRPMILACPSDGLWRDGSGYLDHAGGGFETWIVRDALGAVRSLLGPGAGTGPAAIAGLSMGGYGALRLAARHPDVFAAGAGHSSVTTLAGLRSFSRELPALDAVPAGERDLVDILRGPAALPPIRFDCGTEDHLLAANRALHVGLLDAGIAHEYAEHPGGHEWPYWATRIEDTLRFVDRVLVPPD